MATEHDFLPSLWQHLRDPAKYGDYADFAAWFVWKHGARELTAWLIENNGDLGRIDEYGKDCEVSGEK